MPARIGRGDDRGSSIVEAVIIIPLLVGLTLLIVQFTLIWHARHVAQAAAQAAAVAAAAYHAPGGAGTQAEQAYLDQVAPTLLQHDRVTVSTTGATVTVVVDARVLTVVPFAGFTIHETASAQVETFAGGR
jgi:Flp pilus assembly protein TadG